jgi:GWxTD domain-containing protein
MPCGVSQRGKWVVQISLVLALLFFPILPLAQRPPAGSCKRHSTPQGNKEPQRTISITDDFTSYWLEEDIRWIITDEERGVFKLLKNDEERNQFIEQFWFRRDPTPDTLENEYREEHYRRMVYANEQFASAIPGWKTDRGRIYVMYGPPDEVKAQSLTVPSSESADNRQTQSYPLEVWNYRYLEGIGQEVELQFVDTCRCGDYRYRMSEQEKAEILLPPGSMPWQKRSSDSSNLQAFLKSMRPAKTQSRDFLVIERPIPPFKVQTDFFRVTRATDWVRLTLEIANRDVIWKNSSGRRSMKLKVQGRVTTLTGRVASSFEDAIEDDVASEAWVTVADGTHMYWWALEVTPGPHRVDLKVEDLNGKEIGTWSQGIIVPDYSGTKLEASSLILADDITPSKQSGENFVVGANRVRPRLEPLQGTLVTFKRAETLNLWMQVYNLPVDANKHRPTAAINYEIVNSSNQHTAFQLAETTENLGQAGEQITLQKSVPLDGFESGPYQVTVKVTDPISKHTVSATSAFLIE